MSIETISPAMIWTTVISSIAMGFSFIFRNAITNTISQTCRDALRYRNRRVNRGNDPALGEFRPFQSSATGAWGVVYVDDRIWSWNSFDRLVKLWVRYNGGDWFPLSKSYEDWEHTQIGDELPRSLASKVPEWEREINLEKTRIEQAVR